MQIDIGKLSYIGHRKLPGKLAKALAVTTAIHSEFAVLPYLRHPEVSKESCVLCALTVRDFLLRIGFKDASVRSVGVIIVAQRNGEHIHSLGVGMPQHHSVEPNKWCGHLVTTVDGFLIDTTLVQLKRPAWPNLPEQVVMQILDEAGYSPPPQPGRLRPISAALAYDDATEIEIVYLDRPENQSWKTGPDTDKVRRRPVIDALVKRFGVWRG